LIYLWVQVRIFEMSQISPSRIKQIVEQESPELVAALLVSMAEHIESQKKLIVRLEAENLQKSQESFLIEEKVKLLKRQLFGRKKEDRPEASDRPRDKSQQEALLFSQSAFPTIEVRDQKGIKIKDRWLDLEQRQIDHDITNEELLKESESRGLTEPAASQWAEIPGSFDTVTKIQIIERKYVKELHRKKKYKLRSEFLDQVDGKDVILTAQGPATLLPGMNYTTEFVASVVADKYISHMPLERQTREMESLGLTGIENSTLARQCALGAASLEVVAERVLKEDLLPSDLSLHIDENPWPILNKNQRDGQMWVISNRYGSFYFFEPTRSARVLVKRLGNYSGPVVTDGLPSYDKVLEKSKIPHAYCWAHARREFYPLEDHDPTVKPILDAIDDLFAVERLAKTFEDLKTLRQDESSKILDRIKLLLVQELPRTRDGDQKRKAILYLQKRWAGFTLFLKDTRIPLSNNEAERTIRHAVVGRKNYYGSGSHSGAETAATMFTIIESCKKNDIDPRTYIIQALTDAAAGREIVTPLGLAKKLRS
jgi:hypothetical protein